MTILALENGGGEHLRMEHEAGSIKHMEHICDSFYFFCKL